MTDPVRQLLIKALNLPTAGNDDEYLPADAAYMSTVDLAKRVIDEWYKSTTYWHGRNTALLAQVKRLQANPGELDLSGPAVYQFATVEDALAKVTELGYELQAARRRNGQCLAHLQAAIRAADLFPGITRQALIEASGVSRRTAYAMFDQEATS